MGNPQLHIVTMPSVKENNSCDQAHQVNLNIFPEYKAMCSNSVVSV